MTNAQIEKMRKTLKNEAKDLKPGSKGAKDEALRHLLAAGIVTPKGTLRKAYR
jgi:hypothetical protein